MMFRKYSMFRANNKFVCRHRGAELCYTPWQEQTSEMFVDNRTKKPPIFQI
jgi:hypothetical protein